MQDQQTTRQKLRFESILVKVIHLTAQFNELSIDCKGKIMHQDNNNQSSGEQIMNSNHNGITEGLGPVNGDAETDMQLTSPEQQSEQERLDQPRFEKELEVWNNIPKIWSFTSKETCDHRKKNN